MLEEDELSVASVMLVASLQILFMPKSDLLQVIGSIAGA